MAAPDPSLDPNFRMGAGEAAEHFGQNGFAEILLQAKPYPAFQLDIADGGGRLVIELDQAPRIAEHRLAGFGERQATPRLAQDRYMRLLLELLQLRADGRGRAAEPFGCFGETAQLHACDESPQDVEIECDALHEIVLILRIIDQKLPDFMDEAMALHPSRQGRPTDVKGMDSCQPSSPAMTASRPCEAPPPPRPAGPSDPIIAGR